MGLWYEPKRDGSIDDYVENCRTQRVPPSFKGLEQFQKLVDLGYVVPNSTSIRIMYGDARSDEFYGVTDGFKLEGADLPMHSGKPGIHQPKELLSENTPYFEIDMLNPDPKPGNF